jgi:hypothetical protein
MKDNTAIKPDARQADFWVWSAARRIGTARWNADGAILVKLDAGEMVKSGGFFLYPVRAD